MYAKLKHSSLGLCPWDLCFYIAYKPRELLNNYYLVSSSIDSIVVVFISIEELLQAHPVAVEDQPVSVTSGSIVKSDQVNSEVGKFKNLKELHLISKLFPQISRVLYRIFHLRGEIIGCSTYSN